MNPGADPDDPESIESSVAPCANCGAAMTGRYCAACGQDGHFDLTLRHFLAETVEGLTHFESSFWRTVKLLLFRPGELTRQYLAGKRQHYMPPVRSYLVISLLYFLLTSIAGAARVEGATAMQPQDCVYLASDLPSWLLDNVQKACERTVRDHGAGLDQSIAHLMPRVMFCVLPLVALVQFWLYRRRRRFYVESLVFVVHFQSFYFLVGAVVALLAAALALVSSELGHGLLKSAEPLIYCWSAVYLYLANRRYQDGGRLRALVSVAALAFAYLVFVTLGIVTVTLYAIAEA